MRAKQVTQVSEEFADQAGGASAVVPLPPIWWFVRGPRGGIYMATGTRVREVVNGDLSSEWFWKEPHGGRLWVIDKSESAKYVRPGTRLHLIATEAMP